MLSILPNRFRIASFLPAVLLLVAAAGSADDPPRTLTADFAMERSIAALSDTIRSTGRLKLGGPGLLYWEMLEPSRSVLVVNGDRAWIHYPDLGVTKSFQLEKDPVMRVMAEHMLALTAGDYDQVGELYDVEKLEDGSIRLVPLQETVKGVFQEIRVLRESAGVVSWVELRSPSGDRTRIEFTNVRAGAPIDPASFERPGS
ncbi:MAG: outer membrane lipoprotein carrier protein LolA [Polyangia bacterium]